MMKHSKAQRWVTTISEKFENQISTNQTLDYSSKIKHTHSYGGCGSFTSKTIVLTKIYIHHGWSNIE